MGAAVQAALKAGDAAVDDMVVTDVAPFTLGIAVAAESAGSRSRGMFAPIIERGTVIPSSRVKRFSTMSDNQKEILVEVFQGEHSLCERTGSSASTACAACRPDRPASRASTCASPTT